MLLSPYYQKEDYSSICGITLTYKYPIKSLFGLKKNTLNSYRIYYTLKAHFFQFL